MADYYSAASALELDSGEGSDHSDVDSAYGEDNFSRRTQSVTSSVYNYRFEHGRRYHAYQDGQYVVPNDETEQDRLDLQHHLFRLSLDGKLLMADVPDDIQNVLDVGTGTGIWAIEFADEYPGAKVLGLDLSPMQPTMIPPNCSFRIDDVEKEWIDPENLYDLVHSRAMILAFRNWPGFFEHAFKHIKPGGIIELQDLCCPCIVEDPEASANSKIIEWINYVMEAGKKVGIDTEAPIHWVEMLRAAGFEDIHMKWFNWPIGPWAKQKKNKILGSWCQADITNAVDSSIGLFTRALGWQIEEVQVLQAQVKNEIREQKIHAYFPIAMCWARKPLVAGGNSVPHGLAPSSESHPQLNPMLAFDDAAAEQDSGAQSEASSHPNQ